MKKVVVIGGSAGGIQSLCAILKSLPQDFEAPVLAVIHTTQTNNLLAKVFKRSGRMTVTTPEPAAPIVPGQLYVAAPNRHLLVKSHCALSWMGPRENRHRPAVDALFRSAARAYRAHVIGVVLSGALDDGSAGALAIKARGGTVIVQDPADAVVADMPRNVLRQVKTDFCLPASKIASLLIRLASEGRQIKPHRSSARECVKISETYFHEVEPTGLSCPECDGTLMTIKTGKTLQFRCHVGHAFSLESFSEAHADALERALFVALRKLNERRSINENLPHNFSESPEQRKRYSENAESVTRDIRLLHEILARL